MTGSVQNAGDEPNRAGSAHLHPTAEEMKVEIQNGALQPTVYIHGGAAAKDYKEHQRAYENGEAKNGVRSIMVDSKNIYLYNSGSTNTIVIPRPK